MAELKAGDVVRLKSGSPNMTIKWCETGTETNEAWCSWFVGNKLHEVIFVADQLEPVPSEAGTEAA